MPANPEDEDDIYDAFIDAYAPDGSVVRDLRDKGVVKLWGIAVKLMTNTLDELDEPYGTVEVGNGFTVVVLLNDVGRAAARAQMLALEHEMAALDERRMAFGVLLSMANPA